MPSAAELDREINETKRDFVKATQLLGDLFGLPDLQAVFEDEGCRPNQIYTQAPTLLLLILQRLGGGLTLEGVVSELLKHHRDILPAHRRVEQNTLSFNNSAYSKARQSLPLEKVNAFSNAICDHLAAGSAAAWEGRRVMILDGTTITLPPTPELRAAFPPASNQHGESVWPVAMLMVASEITTGCVVVPEIGAMYGENNTSEVAQAQRIIDRLPQDTLILGDSGFGIFQVAFHCGNRDQEFLFRLTTQRFKALKKQAHVVEKLPGSATWHLHWKPSAKDRKNNPDLPKEAEVEVFVHEVELEGEKNLYLVSNAAADAESLGELYLRRYDVEFDIRDVKVTMDTENIRARKLDTVLKELMGSVIAYNLVIQFRRLAAESVSIKPRRLSFSGVWVTFRVELLRSGAQSFEQWQEEFAEALKHAASRKLPNRSRARNAPRVAHPRRQKSTKFQKQHRNKNLKTTMQI